MSVPSSKNPDARPHVDNEKCTKCQSCTAICPSGVLQIDNNKNIVYRSNGFGCIACFHCVMVCQEKAITLSGRGSEECQTDSFDKIDPIRSFNALENILKSRRSIRHFKKESVSPELLKQVIEAASLAPMGIPPWEVGVVVLNKQKDVALLSKDIVKGLKKMTFFLKNPLLSFVFKMFAKKETYKVVKDFLLPLNQEIIEADKKGEDYLCYKAPSLLLFHHSPYCGSEDAVIACTYAMVAAHSLGLGTCMIGTIAPSMNPNKKLLAKYHIPKGHKVALALIVGHPLYTFHSCVKRPFSTVHMFNDIDNNGHNLF